jgi:hypothetical protein
MAAAYDLGAEYPRELEEDSFAILCFRLCAYFPLPFLARPATHRPLLADYLLQYGKWYKKGSNRD